MRLRLQGEFTEEYLKEFISTMDEIEESEKLDVYLSTNGGYSYVSAVMAHILNQYKNLKVYIVDDLSSAGFYLSLKLKCPIEVIDVFTTSLVHLSYTGVEMLSNGTPKHVYGKTYLKNYQDYLEEEKAELKKVLTSEELQKVLSGEDIILNSKRLKQIYESKNTKKRKVQ